MDFYLVLGTVPQGRWVRLDVGLASADVLEATRERPRGIPVPWFRLPCQSPARPLVDPEHGGQLLDVEELARSRCLSLLVHNSASSQAAHTVYLPERRPR